MGLANNCGSIGVAVMPARYGGVKRDKIMDKNG
jgi:hypothetical protein